MFNTIVGLSYYNIVVRCIESDINVFYIINIMFTYLLIGDLQYSVWNTSSIYCTNTGVSIRFAGINVFVMPPKNY